MRSVLVILFLLYLNQSIFSHPHIWVNNAMTLFADKDGKFNKVQFHWEFDELYTAYVTEGKMENADLETVKNDIFGNISKSSYFAFIENSEGTPIPLSNLSDTFITVKNTRLIIEFFLEVENTVNLSGEKLKIMVFDPEYYSDFIIDRELTRIVSFPCKISYKDPKPGGLLMAMAANLDKTDKAPDNLGKKFAEEMTLDCSNL